MALLTTVIRMVIFFSIEVIFPDNSSWCQADNKPTRTQNSKDGPHTRSVGSGHVSLTGILYVDSGPLEQDIILDKGVNSDKNTWCLLRGP